MNKNRMNENYFTSGVTLTGGVWDFSTGGDKTVIQNITTKSTGNSTNINDLINGTAVHLDFSETIKTDESTWNWKSFPFSGNPFFMSNGTYPLVSPPPTPPASNYGVIIALEEIDKGDLVEVNLLEGTAKKSRSFFDEFMEQNACTEKTTEEFKETVDWNDIDDQMDKLLHLLEKGWKAVAIDPKLLAKFQEGPVIPENLQLVVEGNRILLYEEESLG
jgi:hypothetical protein